ncbi:MAG: TolC family protein [Candidatus Tenebribacter burtonii]|jgi:outer membrane protein TolC|nr:TolC family protein [Candidatus Tenebribacter burtonii]
MKIKLTIILLLIISISLSALTLDEAKKLALKNNPDLLAQQQATEASKNTLWQSYLNLIPSASLTGNYTKYDEPRMTGGLELAEELKNYGYSITQPVFNGGKIWLGARMANDGYKIAKESLKNKTLSTIADVESKYFNVLENQILLNISKKDLLSSQTNVEIAQIRFDAGTLSKAEYLQLQSELAGKEVTLIQIENLYQISLLELVNFLQIDKVTELTEIPIESHQPILDKLSNKSLSELDEMINMIINIGESNNSSLKISEISIKTNKKSLMMAGGNFLPSVNLQYSNNWAKYDFQDDYNESGQLGLNFSIPIFPLVDNGLEVAKANHNLKQSKYALETISDGVKLSLQSSLINLVAAAKTVRYSKLAMEFSKETYDQMKERFTYGVITANDLLSAEIMFTSAQNQYTTSFYNFLRTKSTLQLVMGIEDPQILEEIINE